MYLLHLLGRYIGTVYTSNVRDRGLESQKYRTHGVIISGRLSRADE